ncbi:MAG: DUF1638 domain-containing protein [Arenicellales bacterium]
MLKPLNILACGALANELIALKKLNGWNEMNVTCLPAHYHQTPDKIPQAVEVAIDKIHAKNNHDILIAYGDCGTGGRLDSVIEKAVQKTKLNISRLPGAHCYEFFAGSAQFAALHEAELGTFYLTDFLTQHFDTYVWRALGLDRKPELLEMYFGNYKKLVYLAQTPSETLKILAEQHAQTLGLAFEYHYTEYGALGSTLNQTMNVSVPQHRYA